MFHIKACMPIRSVSFACENCSVSLLAKIVREREKEKQRKLKERNTIKGRF